MAEAAGRRLASSGADACGLNHANVFIGDRAMSAWGEEEESRTVMPVLVFCYLFRSLCGAYYMLSNCFQVSLSPVKSPDSRAERCRRAPGLPYAFAPRDRHEDPVSAPDHARWSVWQDGRSAVGACTRADRRAQALPRVRVVTVPRTYLEPRSLAQLQPCLRNLPLVRGSRADQRPSGAAVGAWPCQA